MSGKDYEFINPRDSLDAPRPPVAPSHPFQKRQEENAAKADTAKSESATFSAREPLYSLANLVLDERTALRLQSLKNRFKTHALVYGEWGLSKTDPSGRHIAFNLYGPPGTGKTMCVEALAHEWGKQIIDVSYAEIESKYVGETGKNIVAAFKAAAEQGALLFFDEADSILGQRMTSVTQAADQAVNVARAVMLKQLDAFDGIVAFATNLARNFDGAFFRRIPIHIKIPLPDEEGRRRILSTILPDEVPFKPRIDLAVLAAKTPGLSGGDLKNIVVNAVSDLAVMPWQTMNAATLTEMFVRHAEATAKAKREVGRSPVVTEETVSIPEVQNV
jgi:SpoVK/Ycf46/Vps4 family AAA+-type ATPase